MLGNCVAYSNYYHLPLWDTYIADLDKHKTAYMLALARLRHNNFQFVVREVQVRD